VEGFFDVAALVSAGCLNAGAIMGAHLCEEQVHQLQFLASHINISIVNLFLDRDKAGKEGALKAESLLKQHGFTVRIFDWDQKFERPGCLPVGITSGIKDPADMSGSQLRYLRKTGMI
jgi:DNA primase